MSYHRLGHNAAENLEIIKAFIEAMKDVKMDGAQRKMMREAQFAIRYLESYTAKDEVQHKFHEEGVQGQRQDKQAGAV